MKIQTKDLINYAYTQSFRNMYHKNTPNIITETSSPRKDIIKTTNLTLQYETMQSPTHRSVVDNSFQSPSKSTYQLSNNKTEQYTLQNYSKRLHSTHRKYSFSVFVKQTKEIDLSKKSPTKNISTSKQSPQRNKGFKGIKRLNNHAIKTFYKNFREDPNLPIKKISNQQNENNLRILSQREFKVKKYEVQNYMNKTSRVKNHNQSYHKQKSPQKSNEKHFFNTISYGDKFISRSSSTSKQNQFLQFNKTSRQNQSQRNNCYLQLCPQQSYTQNNETFLKIEKCLIQKKDQNFVKDCYDFKEILLKEQQKRQKKKRQAKREASLLKLLNKNKRQPAFFDFQGARNNLNNKYVSQMREKKKMKKNSNTYTKVDYQCQGNGIEPW